jgi:hypothetical protein
MSSQEIWRKEEYTMQNTELEFYTTSDIRKMLGIGNKTCLDLFHRSDFPCVRIGKSFKITKNNFNEYVSTRRILNEIEN